MAIENPSNRVYPWNQRDARLQAEGNITYLDFIRLVKEMWAEVHPDIPIWPTQGSQYAQYPCIVYGLETRTTFQNESKKRYREERKQTSEGKNTLIYGQRFQNIIRFSVITKKDPDLAEIIIELFEDFMENYTPVFKRLGVSDFFYARREPDDEGTRSGDDVSIRSVSYLVILEKMWTKEVDQIEQIVTNARQFIFNYGQEFTVTAPAQVLTIEDHTFKTGDLVEVRAPHYTSGGYLPTGLQANWPYYVGTVTVDTVQLLDYTKSPITLSSSGSGKLILMKPNVDVGAHVLEDYHQTEGSYVEWDLIWDINDATVTGGFVEGNNIERVPNSGAMAASSFYATNADLVGASPGLGPYLRKQQGYWGWDIDTPIKATSYQFDEIYVTDTATPSVPQFETISYAAIVWIPVSGVEPWTVGPSMVSEHDPTAVSRLITPLIVGDYLTIADADEAITHAFTPLVRGRWNLVTGYFGSSVRRSWIQANDGPRVYGSSGGEEDVSLLGAYWVLPGAVLAGGNLVLQSWMAVVEGEINELQQAKLLGEAAAFGV